jgi:predicted RNA-binding protein with PIN domain
MSLIDKIRSLFNGGNKSKVRLYVIDGAALLQSRDGRINPRDIFGLLHRIGRFSEREKIEIQVVFESAPLNRAPDGQAFHGVSVYYEKTGEARKTRILRAVRENRARVTVITQDPDLDRHVLAAGGEVLRAATFRKVLDSVSGGEESRERYPDSGRDRQRRRGGRRSRSGGGGPQSPRSNGPDGAAEPKPQGGNESSEQDNGGSTVHDLIDLVE